MGRAYSIRPYSIGDFPATYDHNLGLSSHPWLASCSSASKSITDEPYPGSNDGMEIWVITQRDDKNFGLYGAGVFDTPQYRGLSSGI